MKNIFKNCEPGSRSSNQLPFRLRRTLQRLFLYSAILISIIVFAISCKSNKAETPANPDVYYTCSMDPQVKENKPGKCPVCKMEMTPVKKSNAGTIMDEIELSEQQVQLGNIRMDTIRNGSI